MNKPSFANRLITFLLKHSNFKSFFYDFYGLDPLGPHFATLIHQRRQKQDKKTPPQNAHRHFNLTTTTLGHLPLHLLQTKPTPHNHLIFYLHGGGYILGPGTPQWSLSQYLARHTQHDLALLDYPKAPENNAATTIDITNQAFDHLLKQYPANHITIIGDSAGGGLALALAHYRRDHNLSLPRQLILLSPWLDLTLAHPAIPQYQNDVILDQQGLILCGLSYAADQDPQHPYLSPINAPPHQNLPTHIFASTAEILYPDCHDYAQLAQQQNAPTHLHTYHQTPHVWPLIPMPETTHARQKMRTLLTP